jgi:hypothetical protein
MSIILTLALGGTAQAVILALVVWHLDQRRQRKHPGTFQHVYQEIARVEAEARVRHDVFARDIRIRFDELAAHDTELVAKAGREFYNQISELMHAKAYSQALTGQQPYGRRKSDLVKAAAEEAFLGPEKEGGA